MKTSILIGAGATLAEALPSNPPRKRQPPLDTTFFELCKLAYIEGRYQLARYMTAQYGIDPFDGLRMEEVFNVVYADAISADPPAGSLDAYWALLKMYRDAIQLTTNDVSGTSRAGVGALFRYLVRTDPAREITFITFNQDLVIEKAIEAAVAVKAYSHVPWNIMNAYAMDFASFTTVQNTPRFRSSTPTADSIRVLKLHGSMNWLYAVRSADDAKNSLRTATGELRCNVAQRISRSVRYVGGTRAVPVVPLIVPPVYEKSQLTRDRLQPVWSEAQRVLAESDELIVFGYSFPDSDLSARNALRRAFHNNSKIDRVHVIDTSPEAGARIGGMVRAQVTTRYQSMAAFRKFFARE